MNRFNFWSRKRTDAAKAEAKASEPPDEERPTLTKKTSRQDAKKEDVKPEPVLNEEAPQEYTPESSAKSDATTDAPEQPAQAAETEAETPQLQEETAEADTTAPATAVEEAHQESEASTAAPTDKQDEDNASQMPGGASTSAPHTEEEVEEGGHEEVYAAGQVNDKGEVVDDEGNVIGKVEGDIEKLAGHAVDEDGDVLDDEGNVIGKAIPLRSDHDHPETSSAEQTESPEEKDDDKTKTSSAEESALTSDPQKPSADDLSDAAAPSENQGPVLSKDNEQFLNELTSEVEPQQPPTMSRRPTEIADNGELVEPADIALPTSPSKEDGPADEKKEEQKVTTWRDRWNQWSFVPAAPSTSYFSYRRSAPKEKKEGKDEVKKETEDKPAETSEETPEESVAEEMASNAAKATESVQGAESTEGPSKKETEKETEEETKDEKAATQSHEAAQHRDLTHMLSNLKLSSLNNSVISISHETQHLLENFTIVLKDIVNGAPTAYYDLDKLITERQDQLDNLFGSMPPFVQTLVKSIPVKMYGALAPQVAAAMSAGAEDTHANTFSKRDVETDAANTTDDEAEVVLPFNATGESTTASSSSTDKSKKKKKSLVPSLKSLISEKGTAAAMLRSILNFLQARFPAFITGSNVLMSVAVFILLFVFWYCHKRGKAMRLSRAQAEQVAAAVSLEELEEGTSLKEACESAKDKEAQKTQEVAAEVPLPGADADSKAEGKDEPKKEEDDEKQESEPKPKSLDQRAAELLGGASSATPAQKAEPTQADDETMRKLKELQQKSVDDAAVHGAQAGGEHDDDADADADANAEDETAPLAKAKEEEEAEEKTQATEEAPKPSSEAEETGDQETKATEEAPASGPEPANEDPVVEENDKENQEPAAEQPAADTPEAAPQAESGQKQGAGKVSFGDLMKALETHAKSQPKMAA